MKWMLLNSCLKFSLFFLKMLQRVHSWRYGGRGVQRKANHIKHLIYGQFDAGVGVSCYVSCSCEFSCSEFFLSLHSMHSELQQTWFQFREEHQPAAHHSLLSQKLTYLWQSGVTKEQNMSTLYWRKSERLWMTWKLHVRGQLPFNDF